VDVVGDSLTVKYVPTADALKAAYDLGVAVAEKLTAACGVT